jgi:pyrroloquinoline quinone (PQQ) biosynthesis protein C
MRSSILMRAEPTVNLAQLRQQVRLAWGSSGVDPDAVTAAAASSAELARRAYVEEDRDARWRAESIIYFLNLDSSFAPPADPAAGVIWSTLIQAKLTHLRKQFAAEVPSGDFTVDDMQSLLEAAVERWGTCKHPLLDDLEHIDNLDAYRLWAKNWFGSCYGFSLQLASLFQRTTGEAKKAVLENLSDEFDGDVNHDTLRVRFYSALGLTHSAEYAIHDRDWVLESTELLNLRTGLCNLADPMPALGCFYGIEANWPPECRRHHALNKRRGLDDHTVQYWTTHAFADEVHADEWLAAIKSLARTSAQRACVVEGAIIQLCMRWRMYDAIRERVLATAG